MSKKASWHAPMSTSQRKRRNRKIAIVTVVVVAVVALLGWLVVPRVAGTLSSAPESSSPEIDTSQIDTLIQQLDDQQYLEVEGKVELAHLGEHTAVGGYRKSDGTVVGTVRGGGTSVSFTDTGAEVFIRTDEAGWYLLSVEGVEELWARAERGLLFDPIIVMPFSSAMEATSGDYVAVSPVRRNYENGTSLQVDGERLIFTNDQDRQFAYTLPKGRTGEGLENYVSSATRTQAEVIRDGERTWLRLPDGYVSEAP